MLVESLLIAVAARACVGRGPGFVLGRARQRVLVIAERLSPKKERCLASQRYGSGKRGFAMEPPRRLPFVRLADVCCSC